MSNNAAESNIARNNYVLGWSAWLSKLINSVKSMETLANWLFVFKNKFANKYTFPENKLYLWKKLIKPQKWQTVKC